MGEELDLLSRLQSRVLSGIISNWDNPRELDSRMGFLQRHILDEYLEGDFYQIWQCVMHYYNLTGGIHSPTSFEDWVRGQNSLDLSERIRLFGLYWDFANSGSSLVEFRISVIRLAECWRDDRYTSILSNATRIHLGGLVLKNQEYAGYQESRIYLEEQLHELELLTRIGLLSEGDINQEDAEIISHYEQAKKGLSIGALTGFSPVDQFTNGAQPGELWLIAAYTSEGKSKLVYNMAYHACYQQGKNVIFGANEASKFQVHLNFVVRHSHHPKFQPNQPLSYQDVKYGKLDADGEKLLSLVLDDLKHNPDYGRMFVFQMPARVTPDYVAQVVRRQSRVSEVGLLVVDYLGLMTSRKRTQRREELDDVLVHAKQIALEEHVPFISPWQMSRISWEKAITEGAYTKASLADTSQAEKASDVVISILKSARDASRLRCQFLKNRDGDLGTPFELRADFGACLISSPHSWIDDIGHLIG